MKRIESFFCKACDSIVGITVAAVFIMGPVMIMISLWNSSGASEKRDRERIEQWEVACDALHESILLASGSEMNEFPLNSKFLYVVSRSEQPLSIWNRDFVSSGGLLEGEDFIVADDGRYFLKPDSVRGGLVRIIENSQKSIKELAAIHMLVCMKWSKYFEGGVKTKNSVESNRFRDDENSA